MGRRAIGRMEKGVAPGWAQAVEFRAGPAHSAGQPWMHSFPSGSSSLKRGSTLPF